MVLMTPIVTESFDSVVEVYAQSSSKKKKQKKSSSSKKSSKKSSSKSKSSKKSSSKKSTSKKKSGSKSSSKAKSPTTSADARKQQQKAQQEIKLTKQQIGENERLVKKSLNDLNSIKSDISVSEKQILQLTGKISKLNEQLISLNTQIVDNEKKLTTLRDKYLKVVKKMRLVKGNTDGLTFIFASKSFSQAYRRLRYLREFSKWRENQVAEISKVQAELKQQHEALLATKSELDKVVEIEQQAKAKLLTQKSKQDVLVADLQRNGIALNSHLKKKQQEVNDLQNRIADLIAAEQRAVEEKRRKEEEQRRLAEEKAQKEAEAKKETERQKANEARETKAEEDKGKNKKKKDKGGESIDKKDRSYADARKRKERDKTSKGSTKSVSQDESSFEKMKGNLPRPVSGMFKVVVPFGRHSLPDLPTVEYDNPGIDAEVAPGSSALAVFAGEVSGVYLLKGFDAVIIVNHGSYYTVYGNIATPIVKVGDKVKTGQALGKLFTDASDNNRTVIHFEVWKGREKQNPMLWIK